MSDVIVVRALERGDLPFVHSLKNNAFIMSYWFEEPYEAFVELQDLYDKHIHDMSERRFVIENEDSHPIGLVELVEINLIHRTAEFQIMIDTKQQGKGYATRATQLAMDYGFKVLNLHKLYLVVDERNKAAIHVYDKSGFIVEGLLRDEFFTDGKYQNAVRMSILQEEYVNQQ